MNLRAVLLSIRKMTKANWIGTLELQPIQLQRMRQKQTQIMIQGLPKIYGWLRSHQ